MPLPPKSEIPSGFGPWRLVTDPSTGDAWWYPVGADPIHIQDLTKDHLNNIVRQLSKWEESQAYKKLRAEQKRRRPILGTIWSTTIDEAGDISKQQETTEHWMELAAYPNLGTPWDEIDEIDETDEIDEIDGISMSATAMRLAGRHAGYEVWILVTGPRAGIVEVCRERRLLACAELSLTIDNEGLATTHRSICRSMWLGSPLPLAVRVTGEQAYEHYIEEKARGRRFQSPVDTDPDFRPFAVRPIDLLSTKQLETLQNSAEGQKTDFVLPGTTPDTQRVYYLRNLTP